MITVAITLILFFTWFAPGIAIMQLKFKVWQILLINDGRALQTEIIQWKWKELFILFILWPSQTACLLFQPNNTNKKLKALPIVPIRLDVNQHYRSVINASIIDCDLNQRKIKNEWKIAIIVLGWANVVLYFVDFLIAIVVLLTAARTYVWD